MTERRKVCDKQTLRNMRVIQYIGGLILTGVVSLGANQYYIQKDISEFKVGVNQSVEAIATNLVVHEGTMTRSMLEMQNAVSLLTQAHTTHLETWNKYLASIPPGFYTKQRYGASDAEQHRREDELERERLRQEIELRDKEMERRLSSLETNYHAHNAESARWKDMIKDMARSIETLKEVIWKLTGSLERDVSTNG